MPAMTSRERVLAAFDRTPPDRVPFDLGSRGSSLAISLYEDLKRHLGIERPPVVLDRRLGLAAIDEDVLERFGVDTRYVYLKTPASFQPRHDPETDSFTDEWGGTLRRPKGGFYYDHVDFPIKEGTIEAVTRHPLPDPDDPTRTRGLREEARAFYDAGYAVGTYMKGVSETIWILRGLENAYMDMALNPKVYHALADRVSTVLARMVENLFREVGDSVQFLCVTCDLGTQHNLMVSPRAYKEFIRPYEGRLFEAARKTGKARIAQHSCGAVAKIIPLIIESGVEILNPVQTNAAGMDTAFLNREFGKDLCFWGGIDAQRILPFGTPAEVRAEVARVIGDLAPGGGYLCGPTHGIQAFTPPENVVAMCEAVREFGARR